MNTKPTEFKLLKYASIYGVYRHTMKKLSKPVRMKSSSRSKSSGGFFSALFTFFILGLILK